MRAISYAGVKSRGLFVEELVSSALRSAETYSGRMLIVGMLVYLLIHLTTGWLQIDMFMYGKEDTAVYEHGLWLASQLRIPITLAYAGYHTNVFLGNHFMPIAFVYGLLYRLWDSVWMTILIEAVSFAATAVPIYTLAKHLLGHRWLSLTLAASYLLSYTPTPGHFYFENLAIPFVATAMLWTLQGKYRRALLMWILAMMFKEYLSWSVALLGLLLTLRRDSRRAGTFLTLIGSLWFPAAYRMMRVVQPQVIQFDYLGYLGRSEVGLVSALLYTPEKWLPSIFNANAARHLWNTLFPLGLLPLLGIELIIPTLPIVGVNLLAAAGAYWEPTGHHSAFILPFFFAAGVVGLRRLVSWHRQHPSLLAKGAMAVVLILLVLGGLTGLRYRLYKLKEAGILHQAFAPHSQDVQAILGLIPSDAPVAAVENLLPHVSHRDTIVHLANLRFYKPQYIILDNFYDRATLLSSIDRAMSQGWAGLVRPSPCYDPSEWSDNDLISSETGRSFIQQGYMLGHRRGSIGLFVECSGTQKAVGESATVCGADAGGE